MIRASLDNAAVPGAVPANPSPVTYQQHQPILPQSALPLPANDNTAAINDALALYVRKCFEASKTHRQQQGIDDRMIGAMRAVRGEYDAQTLNDIKAYGGSELYARITAAKVRGVASLLREIYTSSERPWALSPTPEPELQGPSIAEAVMEVIKAEMAEVMAGGTTPDAQLVQQRMTEIRGMLVEARKKSAEDGLRNRETVIDDLLWEGGFYNALWEFLLDIATFQFAVIEGPVVRYKRRVKWEGKIPTVKSVPTMEWERCSPFDVFFAPWAQSPQDGYIIRRQRTTRASLQALIGLPGYNSEAIREVLDSPNESMKAWFDYVEQDRADLEQRSSDTNMMSTDAVDRPMPMLKFHGPVSGKTLVEWGMSAAQVPDSDKDLDITAYLIGTRVIGVSLNPHPAGHKPFYVDSFERIPGSIYGHAVPDLIEDIQGVCNATLRALVNNLAIGSGPMAWINEDRMATNDENSTKMWPWKVFRTTDSLSGNGASDKPMEFFQPNTNSQELMGVFERFAVMADELSSLPRHMQGQPGGLGGAGRTASGMSMLIEAGNRTIKQTVASIDANIIEPVIENLNIYLALLRPDVVMEGDISVVARGAVELVQRETLRMRRLEFLNITNNPLDSQLIGPLGRYNVLKEISRDLGLPTSSVMPQDVAKMMADQQAAQAQGAPPPGGQPQPGQQPQQQGAPPPAPTDGVARPMSPSPGG